jgi:hypothetical protein
VAATIKPLYEMFNKENDTDIIGRGRKAAFEAYLTTSSLKVT